MPIGQGETSIGRYVASAINALKNVNGLDYEITPMGTILAASRLETILEAVKAAHEAIIAKGILRIETTLRIDERRDKPRTMSDKVEAVRIYMQQH